MISILLLIQFLIAEKHLLYTVSKMSPGVVIGSNGCKFCQDAVDLLKMKNIEFTYIGTEQRPDVHKAIVDEYKYQYVPCIFYEKEFIGGFSELKAKLEQAEKGKNDEILSYISEEELKNSEILNPIDEIPALPIQKNE